MNFNGRIRENLMDVKKIEKVKKIDRISSMDDRHAVSVHVILYMMYSMGTGRYVWYDRRPRQWQPLLNWSLPIDAKDLQYVQKRPFLTNVQTTVRCVLAAIQEPPAK